MRMVLVILWMTATMFFVVAGMNAHKPPFEALVLVVICLGVVSILSIMPDYKD